MISWISALTFLLYFFSFNSCQKSDRTNAIINLESEVILNYDLNNPNKSIKLPSNIVEISGLTYWSENTLACVNDEKGNVYLFDLDKEEITSKRDFGKNDDYEGIEKVGSSLYISNSSGTLIRNELCIYGLRTSGGF